MQAALVTQLIGSAGVEVRDVYEPASSPHHVLIDVAYAAVGFPDLLQARGEYQRSPNLPFIPGWEVSGVVRIGAGRFRTGDRVAALPMQDGLAQTVAVHEDLVFPLPAEVSIQEAAALPLNYLTMHLALTRRGRLTSGETVLVHGAAGGLGTAACQLAKAYGARVIGVVSSPDKRRIAEAAGSDEVVLVAGFRDEVRRLTGGAGVDLVVDPVGGDRFTDSLRCLASEGRVLVLGFTAGSIPSVKVNRLLLTNTAVIGVGSVEFWNRTPGYVGRQWAELLPLMQSRAIQPLIGPVFELNDAANAIAQLEERRALGRILIQLP